MLLQIKGVETTARELVGSSQVPYQLRLKAEENELSAGMLVQGERNVNLVLCRYGYKLNSVRASTMEEYFELATLLSGEAFITTIKRPNNLPGRHAVVFTGLCDSLFQGLDPDCRLNRSVDHSYSAVKGSVALDLGQAEFIRKVSGMIQAL
ncbi:hypothetical protein CSA37_12490 [Candidatus Fermentibacteria bacterium]|nr:MAG: hypothetical protein CSA37_12490 [Candidatus Fermentibacteria bacterium]